MPSKGMPNLMGLMKLNQAGRSFLLNSSTVPMRELHPRPHAPHLKRWSPDAMAPASSYPEIRAGERRMRAIRGRRLAERPESAAITAFAPPNDGGKRLEIVGRKRRGEHTIRVRLRHGWSSYPSKRPSDRIVAKQRIRWALGHLLCWLKPSWQLAEGIIGVVC